MAVARLIPSREKPQGDQITAYRKIEGESTQVLESLPQDLKPGDLLLSKVKSPYRGMEA